MRKIDNSIDTPKVSVIVPVYNMKQYLGECIDSILKQTLTSIEVICIDDGSTDNSLQILEEFKTKDNRIYIYGKKNEGLGAASARNCGLNYARGEYVLILDSDDFFEPAMIEIIVERAEKTNADIVIFGGYEYDDKRHIKRVLNGILNEKFIPKKKVFSASDCSETIFQLSQGMAWNKLFKRAFIENTGIRFQNIKFSDDAYFTFSNMVLARRITVINELLINYRVNTGGSQTDRIAGCPDSAYLPYVELRNFLKERNLYDIYKKSFINCASGFMRFCYDIINQTDAFCYLHDKYRNEIFDLLEIEKEDETYYYDKRVFTWIRQVVEHTSEEVLFLAARSHGDVNNTTGILRFQFPYNLVPVMSKIVIIGTGICGRYYVSQAIMSGRYKAVIWADRDEKNAYKSTLGFVDLNSIEYDYVIITYSEKSHIDDAITYFTNAGIPIDRIIIGEYYQ